MAFSLFICLFFINISTQLVDHAPFFFDEATSCAPAFGVLKQLIQRCLGDAVASRNVYVDIIRAFLFAI